MARILLVDDSELSRLVVREAFEKAGHTVVGEASDGAEGFEKYKELRPDITTMDITMPVMDGLSALKEIIEFDSGARVIMMSSAAQSSKIAEALIVGAYEFMPKPFDKAKLAEMIDYVTADL